MWISVDFLSIYYLLAKIIATFIVMIFNFVTRKLFLEQVIYMDKISIIVPCYNEEESIPLFYKEIS